MSDNDKLTREEQLAKIESQLEATQALLGKMTAHLRSAINEHGYSATGMRPEEVERLMEKATASSKGHFDPSVDAWTLSDEAIAQFFPTAKTDEEREDIRRQLAALKAAHDARK